MNAVWIILTGSLVAASCGFIGCFLILRRMAMLGDAMSHAVLPGIVIAYLFTNSREMIPMLLGATALGLACSVFIQYLKNNGVQNDAAVSVSFTFLFAVGIILVSLFARQVDIDLDCVLYGEIAYVPWDTWEFANFNLGPRALWLIGGAFLISIIMVTLFYKQFKLCTFDPLLAVSMGIPVTLFHYLLTGLVSMTTVASFESVGAILVVAMLIVPAATAYLLTDRLSVMLLYSIIIGITSSALGYAVSSILDASIAGCMSMVAGFLFVCAFLFSPTHGVVTRWWVRRKLITEE